MKDFKPSIGNPARGNAFYPRKKEIEKIYDLLELNVNIYLSAPRRVGKTSILKHLEDTGNENGYYFIYMITESVYSINEFYKVLYNDLIGSNAIKSMAKLSEGLTRALTTILDTVDEAGGVKLKDQEEPDYHQKFIDLLNRIDKGIGRLVIMIDEYPQTLHNIHKKHGEIEARKFLQLNRVIRVDQVGKEKVSFIYTGSIALFPMVEKIGSLNDVNDMKVVEVKPLGREEAKELLGLLCKRKNVLINEEATEFMLDELQWYIPFHIQLIYQELQDIFYDKQSMLDENDVNTAITRTIDAKNKAMFEPYFSRLKGLLERNEYLYAMEVLVYTAHNNVIDKATFFDLSQKHDVGNYKEILDNLCEDGYLYVTYGKYTYTSPILQLWCKKNNENGI